MYLTIFFGACFL